MEEITAKGLKPGDLVGELQDTSTIAAEAAALSGAGSRDAGKQDKSVLGIYRAGGPTTIFGGSGWGPYSDGPLNAVKKSMLNREGLNEENWMFIAAQRTLEMSEEWKNLRHETLKANGGSTSDNRDGDVGTKRAADDEMDVDTEDAKRPKRDAFASKGIYDPQTGHVFCKFFRTMKAASHSEIDHSRPVKYTGVELPMGICG